MEITKILHICSILRPKISKTHQKLVHKSVSDEIKQSNAIMINSRQKTIQTCPSIKWMPTSAAELTSHFRWWTSQIQAIWKTLDSYCPATSIEKTFKRTKFHWAHSELTHTWIKLPTNCKNSRFLVSLVFFWSKRFWKFRCWENCLWLFQR